MNISTCLHATSSRREGKHFDISNVIYHKLSHGAVSYTLNGENINVMLEFAFLLKIILIGYLSKNMHFLKTFTADYESIAHC